jgi:hypothetical protein
MVGESFFVFSYPLLLPLHASCFCVGVATGGWRRLAPARRRCGGIDWRALEVLEIKWGAAALMLSNTALPPLIHRGLLLGKRNMAGYFLF